MAMYVVLLNHFFHESTELLQSCSCSFQRYVANVVIDVEK